MKDSLLVGNIFLIVSCLNKSDTKLSLSLPPNPYFKAVFFVQRPDDTRKLILFMDTCQYVKKTEMCRR